ncbi:MAG: HlyD family efflux transporter periplasmic adaptor subunit [Streptococcaceae bacterium]|jgi:hypothetical protein|nr:HlyD family efflux transporter periplasmic adaptor subunit [Streptococcaceae bacterium]
MRLIILILLLTLLFTAFTVFGILLYKKQERKWLSTSASALVVVTVLFFAVLLNPPKAPQLTKVDVETVQKEADLIYKGVAQPKSQENFANPVASGEGAEAAEVVYSVSDGQAVQAGDLLFTTVSKSESNNLQLQFAKEDLDDANNGVNQAIAAYNKTPTPENLDKVNQAKDKAKQAERAYETAVASSDQATKKTYATTSGKVIIDKNATKDKPMLSVVSEETSIESTVYQEELGKLSVGQPVKITVGNSTKTINGKIATISQSPVASNSKDNDGQNQSQFAFTVEPESPIHQGFNCQLNVVQSATYIPQTSLVDDQHVYVYADGRIHLKQVVVQLDSSGARLISGLSEGEQVVTSATTHLKDNEKVAIH